MKSYFYQKLIYKLVSQIIILPIYKLIFRGKLIGRENIPQKGAFIMVSNHGSLLDPPLLGHAIGRNISFMAKSELFRIPLLGFIIKSCGAYPVKRGIVDKTTIKTACKKLLNNNLNEMYKGGCWGVPTVRLSKINSDYEYYQWGQDLSLIHI